MPWCLQMDSTLCSTSIPPRHHGVRCMEDALAVTQTQELHDNMTNTWVDDHAQFHHGIQNHDDKLWSSTDNHIEGWHSYLNKVGTGHILMYMLLSRCCRDWRRSRETNWLRWSMVSVSHRGLTVRLTIDCQDEDHFWGGLDSPLEFLTAAWHKSSYSTRLFYVWNIHMNKTMSSNCAEQDYITLVQG